MVNTRRTESIGSSAQITTRHHRTRGAVKQEVSDTDSSSVNESDNEECNVDDSISSIKKKTPSLPSTSLSQLDSNFRERDRNYSSRPVRNSRKLISLNERQSLRVYSSRKMQCDSDFDNGNDFEDELYPRRRRHSDRSHMSRMERRTALSLRPIRQKCYTDPHSPIHFNSDSEGQLGVRRSKRKRVQFRNASWLTDDQMHKVGYPNLNAGYSEEDSRDIPDTELYENRRITRHSNGSNNRHDIKNSKYIYDYQANTEVSSKRHRDSRELRSGRESNDKENKNILINGRANGNLRSVKQEDISKDDTSDQPSTESKDNEETNGETEEIVPENENKVEPPKEESSESEDEDLPRLRTRNRNNNRIIEQKFKTRTRQTKKIVESSSESEGEARKYSLRVRAPKPAPKEMQTSVLRSRSRIHFKKRNVSESSSSSSSSSKERHSKNPKSLHSKNEKLKSGAGSNKIVPIAPEVLDSKLRFSSIGGLDGHIQCLKEMILLPMMYPEVFRQFQMQPPRGVLFHGPPGTGKTLIARALASECSFGIRKVSFFLRKGADLLNKWIGESEKQLRLLFQQAAEMKPSIIFFDELDGLAPVRSSKQDQIHASIVSTLLALMDGLDSRGDVIVIGATNRIDAIDPALRRPGRFDRELFFPLPSRKEREEILKVHVSLWKQPPSQQMISYLAENSVGYCGSDLRALCSEAVIQSFRRIYPQVYSSEHRLLLNPENVRVEKVDFLRAKSVLIPASHRQTQSLGRKLTPILEPLLNDPLKKTISLLEQSFPHGVNSALAKVKLSPNLRPAQLLITGNGSEHGQTCYLAPALLFKMEHIHSYLLDLPTLFQEPGRTPEEACIQVFNEARRNIPSIVYLPNITQWWDLVSETVQAILTIQLSKLDPHIPILFLATADKVYDDLPVEIKSIFSTYRKETFELEPPNTEARTAFFKPLILETSLQTPRSIRERPKTPPPLPRAPTPPPTPLTEEQAQKLYQTEEHTLRELRIFLRDICKKLANNKLFYMFTKPVDTEEVPDYTTIIKQPMDLETMMTKVDFHRYESAKDFLNDIELICQNALEYNPARTSADKQIRHRACSLRDFAYTLIKNEMDTDFEDKCQKISKNRKERKACTQKYLPAYIHTPEDASKSSALQTAVLNGEENKDSEKSNNNTPNIRLPSPHRKRKFSWQKGCLKKRKRTKLNNSQDDSGEKVSTGDESKDTMSEVGQSDKSNKTESTSSNHSESGLNVPLLINCDMSSNKNEVTTPLQSPVRRLSDLLSPSELLDSPLDFDDIDQAMNEGCEDTSKTKKAIECSVSDLEKALDQVVKVTAGYSLIALLDLYNQLNRIIKKYSRTHQRNSLSKELLKEIQRFKKERTAEEALLHSSDQ